MAVQDSQVIVIANFNWNVLYDKIIIMNILEVFFESTASSLDN